MLQWQVGNVKITQIVELTTASLGPHLLPQATPEVLAGINWMTPFVDDQHRLLLSMHTLMIESQGQVIMVDTCIGNDKERTYPRWNHMQTDFLQRLDAAGFATERVDTVLCTHMHVDHVGWNTILENDRWVPTFPNARYLIGREEWAFWEHEDDPFGKQAKQDSILPIVESDLVDFVETNHRLTDEVCLVPTPGHTPGHVSVLIQSRGERAIITGDLFHHPLQFAYPSWKDIADVDGEVAEQTRLAFMHEYGDETLVLGTHFASPTAGHIVRDGEFWRFDV